MRALVLVTVVVGLLVALAGTALSSRSGDPQKRFTPADQVRAKAMLIRKADLGVGFRSVPTSGVGGEIGCAALDRSDLTLTGEAQSPTFQGGVQFVSSASEIYASVAQSTKAWARATRSAADACVQQQFGEVFAKQGAQVESFRRISFPRVSERSIAYRLVVSSAGLRAVVDVVGLKLGRAQSALLLGSALTPMPRDVELKLARTVAGRMAKAMRGAQTR